MLFLDPTLLVRKLLRSGNAAAGLFEVNENLWEKPRSENRAIHTHLGLLSTAHPVTPAQAKEHGKHVTENVLGLDTGFNTKWKSGEPGKSHNTPPSFTFLWVKLTIWTEQLVVFGQGKWRHPIQVVAQSL